MKRVQRFLPRLKGALETRKAKQRAARQEASEKIRAHAAFMEAVETLMREQGLSRMEAIKQLDTIQMERLRTEAGGPPVPEIIYVEPAFEGAKQPTKRKKIARKTRKAVPQERVG